MTPVLVLLAVLVVAVRLVAVAAPDPRHATLGAFSTALLAAFVADPLPSPEALVARAAGAALGGWLVWIVLRPAPASHRQLGARAGLARRRSPSSGSWPAGSPPDRWAPPSAAQPAAGQAAALAGAALAAGSPVALAGVGAACALVVIGVTPVVLPETGSAWASA